MMYIFILYIYIFKYVNTKFTIWCCVHEIEITVHSIYLLPNNKDMNQEILSIHWSCNLLMILVKKVIYVNSYIQYYIFYFLIKYYIVLYLSSNLYIYFFFTF